MNKPFPNGSSVMIKDANIKAKTIGVCVTGIDNAYVEYRIVYWVGGDRKDIWVNHWEIELFEETSKKAGMVNYETSLDKKNYD